MAGMRIYMMKYFKMEKSRYILYFFAAVVLLPFVGYFLLETLPNNEIDDSISSQSGDIYKAELLDSINVLSIDLGRYEVALENLKQEDSVAAKKFEDILYILE